MENVVHYIKCSKGNIWWTHFFLTHSPSDMACSVFYFPFVVFLFLTFQPYFVMVFVLINLKTFAFLTSVMERGSDDTQQPSLCRMGCGFYGSSSSDGMCSKCFKDALRRKQSSPTTSATATVMSSSSTGWCSKSKI